MYNRRFLLTFLVFLFVFAWADAVPSSGQPRRQPGGGTPVDYRSALSIISDKLHQKFPHLEGQIVAVKGGDLYLSISAKDGASEGIRMSIYRKGAPFKHPTTGAVLGTLEEEIGVASVVEVREKFSIVRMVRLTPGKELVPRVGDLARLSSSKLRLAVLPFNNTTKEFISSDILTRELANTLVAGGRFDVFDADRLQVWLLETAIAVDQILKGDNAIRLRNQIRGDLALENIISEIRQKKVITSRLLSLTTRKELFRAVTIVDELPFEQRTPKEQTLRRGAGGRQARRPLANSSFSRNRLGVPGARGSVSNFVFNDVTFRGVTIADIDNDKKNEILIITSHELIAYQISEGRMREVARFVAGVSNDFRWIDAADMNGNGKPEVYIANYRYGSLLSIVLEPDGKGFKKLAEDMNVFFRLIRVRRPEGDGKIPDSEAFLLLGQAQGTHNPLEGPIMRYRWSGQKISQAAPYTLPPNVTILGFGLADFLGSGSFDVVEKGDDDKMRVYSRRGSVRYTSSETYGGSVQKEYYDPGQIGQSRAADEGAPIFQIRSRILYEDVDGDGVREVLVIKNEYGASRIAPGLGVSGGQVISLIWDGSGLSEIWRARKTDSGVADFAFGDADNDGSNDLVIVNANSSAGSGSVQSHIFIYKLRR
ncbi:MAG: VCBS repeat-containing protein [bacterium]|nr:VCBS repeat-containing protein [bacterium]